VSCDLTAHGFSTAYLDWRAGWPPVPVEFERHLESCRECAYGSRKPREISAARRFKRSGLLRKTPPVALRKKIRA